MPTAADGDADGDARVLVMLGGVAGRGGVAASGVAAGNGAAGDGVDRGRTRSSSQEFRRLTERHALYSGGTFT